MLIKKIQPNPQQKLGDQICENTYQKNRNCRFRAPIGISNDNHSLNKNGDEQGVDHFFAERRIIKMTNPMSASPAMATQTQARMITAILGKPSPFDCG